MPGIPSVISSIPVIGGLVNAVDNLFSSPQRKLKNALEKAGLITKEQRALLDDGNALGYPRGDAGIGPKLRDMGVDPATVSYLCQRLGVPKDSVDPDLMWPERDELENVDIFDDILRQEDEDEEQEKKTYF